MLEEEKDKLLKMNQELKKMVVGQNEAIDKISKAVMKLERVFKILTDR